MRDRQGTLRAFYNVCKHRAHRLLSGEGTTGGIVCPYHAWTYTLDGQLFRAPHTESLEGFDVAGICLDRIRVEEFCGFVYVNLDPDAAPLAEQSGGLAGEILHWAPDVERLTFGHRLTYEIRSNWKNVVDNFLECYHCPTAHKDFCQLVDMDTYEVSTHGIYSSHMAEAGNSPQRRLRRLGGDGAHPRGVVAVAQHLSDALPRAQLDDRAEHRPARPRPHLRDLRLLPRDARAGRDGA